MLYYILLYAFILYNHIVYTVYPKLFTFRCPRLRRDLSGLGPLRHVLENSEKCEVWAL